MVVSIKSNSRKSVRWSAVPVAPVSVWMYDGERGSGPEGANDLCCIYCFEPWTRICALRLEYGISAERLGFRSQGCDLGLEVKIWALKAAICAWRLELGPCGRIFSLKAGFWV